MYNHHNGISLITYLLRSSSSHYLVPHLFLFTVNNITGRKAFCMPIRDESHLFLGTKIFCLATTFSNRECYIPLQCINEITEVTTDFCKMEKSVEV
jgi:hypothetical protein